MAPPFGEDIARQLGNLGVLRGAILGFSEEARARGFPSSSFGGFGVIGVIRPYALVLIAPLHRAICRQQVGQD